MSLQTSTSYFNTTYFHVSQGGIKGTIAMYGMKWTDIRSLWKYLWNLDDDDEEVLDRIRLRLQAYVPVRSGHLYDYLCRTMYLERFSWYSTQYWIDFNCLYPADRPNPITGRVSHLFEKGYGDQFPMPPLIYRHPNINGPYIGPRGGSYYWMNDPGARYDFLQQLEDDAVAILEDQTAELFNDLLITLTINVGSPNTTFQKIHV
jgi:hypothetical protein